MAVVSITSFHVQDADGGDTYVEGRPVTVWVECTSDHADPLTVDGSFSLSNGDGGQAQLQLDAGAAEWMSWQSSSLPAGGVDVSVSLSGEVGMASELFAETGLSFEVQGAADLGPSTPHVEIDALALQPLSNVDHDDGTAWSDDEVRASAHVVNHGEATGPVAVTIWSSDGQSHVIETELSAGQDEWFAFELQPHVAGTHEIHAAVSWEGPDTSEVLTQTSRQLTVSERGEHWIEANVQISVNDYRGEPLRGYRIFSRFIGMDGTDYYGGETVESTENEAGVVTSAGIHVQREGTVQIMAVGDGDARAMLEGQLHYTLAEGDTNLAFTADQGVTEQTYRAHSQDEVGEAVQSEFSAGVEIEIIEVGGSVATEQSRSRTYGEAVEWKVRVGLTNLTIEQTS